ncbi:lipopolysaccharide transport periplasmic protein LptA [Bordetella avium]|uniref:Lipopolysaccharide export system protein LptA n=1 Tax=Bordetella avium (strain 197N) TaxID=360910 RepID=Q2KUD3_BORA1|nr:lipopolysaccharide transport periplasmic protein LptA [Bordetella avium]AZY53848.1 lipopolysaccharide transport periplasmic protein LptA [Bordetella avium]RIQ15379.1 lipopolysaccharide transport periplasmic protein LptA [Bordetella avium]RIQ38512.1 lipopolysaccharide transport periplasmic protein LptA [Bordetella avium]RIQ43051.1 lipopolysaccharide transport periplasmic protein LptA [Bordetella avium]RIQ44014.1 lipopolysaccharide transport periplasmic protein LptA [Bordetella avium]
MTDFPFAQRLMSALLLTAAMCAPALAQQAKPEDPSTLILSDSLQYDDVKRQSVFTGNVALTRGLMTLNADKLEVREDQKGNQFGTATANKGKLVRIRQERPDTFEIIEGEGLRADYDGTNSQFDLIGQAVVTRYICGKPFDTIRGDRVRYNEKTGIYQAEGGPNSAAPGGRVRSYSPPRAKADAAIAECRASKKPAAAAKK